MCVRRANDTSLKRAIVDVVGETSMSAEEPVVLRARNPLAEEARAHLVDRIKSAARETASRIDA
jgi:hypothetical protein